MGAQRKRLSLADKETIINESLKPGFDRQKTCEKYGIGKSTLNKQKESILSSPMSKAKSLKKAAHPELEKQLHEWFIRRHNLNLPIDGPTIQDQAEDYAKKLGITDFKCSVGWLGKFKKRMDIKQKTFKGEKLSADHAAANEWIEKDLPKLLEKYKLSDIFNCDETGLYIRGLHNKGLVPANAENFGGKVQKSGLHISKSYPYFGEYLSTS